MALFDSQLTWLANIGSSYLNSGAVPKRWGNAHPNIVPYQTFRAGDGALFVVGVGTEPAWQRLLNLLNAKEQLGNDPSFRNNSSRVQNRAVLIPLLQAHFEIACKDVVG